MCLFSFSAVNVVANGREQVRQAVKQAFRTSEAFA